MRKRVADEKNLLPVFAISLIFISCELLKNSEIPRNVKVEEKRR